MRARLALRAADQQVELREIVLRDKPQAMVTASPKATVPVLVLDNGQVIDESLDIARWALSQNDPNGWLRPQNGDGDTMFALIEAMDGPFKHHLDRYKYSTRHVGVDGDAEAFAQQHRAAAVQELEKLEARLAEHAAQTDQGDGNGTPYLFGSAPCLADIAIAPFVRQFANTDRAWFDTLPLPHLHRWLNAFLESDDFAAIMKKYPVWVDGAAGIGFPETQLNQ